MRREAVRRACRADVDRRIGGETALETQVAARQGEAFAGKIIIAAHQFDTAVDFGPSHRAAHLQVGAPFGLQPHSRDEQAPIGVDVEVEQPARRRHIGVDAAPEQLGVDLRHRQNRHLRRRSTAEAIPRFVDLELARDDAAIFVGRDADIAGRRRGQFVAIDQLGRLHRQPDIDRKAARAHQIDAAGARNTAVAPDTTAKAHQFEARLGKARIERGLVDDRTKRCDFDAGTLAARRAGQLRIAKYAADIGRNGDRPADVDAADAGQPPDDFRRPLKTQLAEDPGGEDALGQRFLAGRDRADTHLGTALDLAAADDDSAGRRGAGVEGGVDADVDRRRNRGHGGARQAIDPQVGIAERHAIFGERNVDRAGDPAADIEAREGNCQQRQRDAIERRLQPALVAELAFDQQLAFGRDDRHRRQNPAAGGAGDDRRCRQGDRAPVDAAAGGDGDATRVKIGVGLDRKGNVGIAAGGDRRSPVRIGEIDAATAFVDDQVAASHVADIEASRHAWTGAGRQQHHQRQRALVDRHRRREVDLRRGRDGSDVGALDGVLRAQHDLGGKAAPGNIDRTGKRPCRCLDDAALAGQSGDGQLCHIDGNRRTAADDAGGGQRAVIGLRIAIETPAIGAALDPRRQVGEPDAEPGLGQSHIDDRRRGRAGHRQGEWAIGARNALGGGIDPAIGAIAPAADGVEPRRGQAQRPDDHRSVGCDDDIGDDRRQAFGQRREPGIVEPRDAHPHRPRQLLAAGTGGNAQVDIDIGNADAGNGDSRHDGPG